MTTHATIMDEQRWRHEAARWSNNTHLLERVMQDGADEDGIVRLEGVHFAPFYTGDSLGGCLRHPAPAHDGGQWDHPRCVPLRIHHYFCCLREPVLRDPTAVARLVQRFVPDLGGRAVSRVRFAPPPASPTRGDSRPRPVQVDNVFVGVGFSATSPLPTARLRPRRVAFRDP
jgi:hypothetical protein